MACLGVEPGVAGWKVQMNPLSYGGTPKAYYYVTRDFRCVSNTLEGFPTYYITIKIFSQFQM